jgi:predicted kinase
MTVPRPVLISGAPGTGKSTLAAALAPRLGAAVLDLDVATGPLTAVVSNLVGAADLSDPRIARLTRTPRYETLFALAEDNLRAGIPVVMVAPFSTERTADGWQGVVRRLRPYAADPVLVWLHLSDADLVDRLGRRNAVRDTAKTANPSAYLAAIDRAPPAAPHIALDAALPVADLVDRVLTRLTVE